MEPLNPPPERISVKLKQRLNQLTATASKESIQTLSNWILFHSQAHPEALVRVFQARFIALYHFTWNVHVPVSSFDPSSQTISQATKDHDHHDDNVVTMTVYETDSNANGQLSNGSQQDSLLNFITCTEDAVTHIILLWKIIHEVCIRYSPSCPLYPDHHHHHHDTSSSYYTVYLPFRVLLAERVILMALTYMMQDHKDRPSSSTSLLLSSTSFQDMCLEYYKIWKQMDCFDSISLMDQIERILYKLFQSHDDEDGENEIMLEDSSSQQYDRNDDDHHAIKESTETNTVHNDTTEAEEGTTEYIIQENVLKDNEEDNEIIMMDTSRDILQEEISTNHIVTTSLEEPSMTVEEESTEIRYGVDDTVTTSSSNNTTSATHPESTTMTTTEEYNFEDEGIPKQDISLPELMESAKSIATMQITRDLRNDNSHTLNTVLQKIPLDVFQSCSEISQKREALSKMEDNETITAARTEMVKQIKDMLPHIPNEALDLDLSSCLNNVRLHREIILQQKQSRQQCINLLIQSRCDLGARDAAIAFYTSVDDLIKRLDLIKEKISDAAELEGLDIQEFDVEQTKLKTGRMNLVEDDDDDDDVVDVNLNDLKDFSWLSRMDLEENAVARKKQRVS